jgi:hypothetical protein
MKGIEARGKALIKISLSINLKFKIMTTNKYCSIFLKMLFKPASSNWPLWWTVLPFLFFYADILLKFSLLCLIIF